MSVIVSDIDGVLASFESAWDPWLARIAGVERKHRSDWVPEIWDWDIRDYGPDIVKKGWAEVAASDKFWLTLKPMPGAYEAGRQLNLLSKSHQVFYLTSRMGLGVQRQTQKWLYNNLGIDYPAVIVVSKWEAKRNLLDNLGADFFVDDKLETMQDWYTHLYTNRKPVANYFLIDAPYNREGRTVKGMKVATNIEAALKEAGYWL